MFYCSKSNQSDTQGELLQMIHAEKSWAWWVNHVGTFGVFVIGFLGNMLCLVFLCRRPFIRTSYTQYLIALAIADTGAITAETVVALDEFYQYLSRDQRTLLQHTVISCKLYYYVRFILYSMSSWIVVGLAVERLVAVKYPLWSKHICSVTNARRIIVLMLVFTMIIQSYHLFTKGIDCSPSKSLNVNCRCKTLPDHAKLDISFTIYVWRLFLMTLVPLIIIITVNILIMSKLFNKDSFIDCSNRANNSRRKIVLRHKVSRMLVIVSSIYLLLHVPGSTLELFKFFLGHALRRCYINWYYYIHVAHDLFDLLTNCNYGINFYLYIISSKHIRSAVLRKEGLSYFGSFRDRQSFQRSKYFIPSNASSPRRSPRHGAKKPLARCETISSV